MKSSLLLVAANLGKLTFLQTTSSSANTLFNVTSKYGLYVDKELHKGTSEITDTFLNRPLASKEHFSISVIEIWGFVEKSE